MKMSESVVEALMALWWCNAGDLDVDDVAATVPAAFGFVDWVFIVGPAVAVALAIDESVCVWWGKTAPDVRRAAVERAMQEAP